MCNFNWSIWRSYPSCNFGILLPFENSLSNIVRKSEWIETKGKTENIVVREDWKRDLKSETRSLKNKRQYLKLGMAVMEERQFAKLERYEVGVGNGHNVN